MTQCPKLYDIKSLESQKRDIHVDLHWSEEGRQESRGTLDDRESSRILARTKDSNKNPEREGGKALMLRIEE